MARASLAALLLLGLAAVSACSRPGAARPGTTARWERRQAVADRRVADAAPRCLKDRLAPEHLAEEIERLERAQPGRNPVQGNWRGKDLSTLPPPQASYLQANDRWIPATGRNSAACSDLPCILNQPYGKSASQQGLKIYGFYLNTGYPISVNALIPRFQKEIRPGADPGFVNFPNTPLSEFLFNDYQLSNLLKLSYLLPAGYAHLETINRFHRVPKWDVAARKALDPMAQEGWDPEKIAMSWGGRLDGIILLRDGIDPLPPRYYLAYDGPGLPDNGIRDPILLNAAHEMTHAWDRRQATRDDYEDQASYRREWLDLSGWESQTVTYTRAGYHKAHGGQDCTDDPEVAVCVVTSWYYGADSKDARFVWDYASSSPEEDLAETAAWVRLRGDTIASKISREKIEHVSRILFGGRTYDDEGLSRYYENYAVTQVKPRLLELVDACLIDSNAGAQSEAPSSQRSARLEFDRSLPEPVVECLERGLAAKVEAAWDELRGVEWEACDHLDAHADELRGRIYAQLGPELARLVSENFDRAPVIRASSELRSSLASQVDPREAYLHCHRQDRARECFEEELGKAFDAVAEPQAAALGRALSDEKAAYLARHPFDETRDRTLRFYQMVLSGIEPQVVASAEERWKGCLSQDPSSSSQALDPGAPPVSPFSGGARFVSAEMLRCLNASAIADLRLVRDQHLARLGLAAPDANVQALIEELLLPTYLEVLGSRQAADSAAEDQARAARKPGVLSVLLSELGSKAGWLGDAASREAALERCAPAAEAAFDAYFARVSPDERLPARFASFAAIRKSWSREACVEIVGRPSVRRVLDERQARAWGAAIRLMDGFIRTAAESKAGDCIARFPGDRKNLIVRYQRNRSCLTKDVEWAGIEKQALAYWENTPEGRVYASRRNEMSRYLKDNRSRFQSEAVSAMLLRDQ